jgi:hypothetical protein
MLLLSVDAALSDDAALLDALLSVDVLLSLDATDAVWSVAALFDEPEHAARPTATINAISDVEKIGRMKILPEIE